MQAYLDSQAGLKRLLQARLGDPAEAEDVLQELYLRLRVGQDEHGIDNPRAYLYRMALNLARDHRRGWERARIRDDVWAGVSQTRLGEDTVVEAPGADRALAACQRLHRVAAMIATFPPRRRQVFTLHKLEGLTHAEVAQQLGISRSAVEKHMTAALKQLVAVCNSD